MLAVNLSVESIFVGHTQINLIAEIGPNELDIMKRHCHVSPTTASINECKDGFEIIARFNDVESFFKKVKSGMMKEIQERIDKGDSK